MISFVLVHENNTAGLLDRPQISCFDMQLYCLLASNFDINVYSLRSCVVLVAGSCGLTWSTSGSDVALGTVCFQTREKYCV